MLAQLPLKFDMEESKAVYPALCQLVLVKHPAVSLLWSDRDSSLLDSPLHRTHRIIIHQPSVTP